MAAAPPAPLVTFAAVTKRFSGVLACDAVDLALQAGEVHVILGENGAGKSTLVGLLAGLLQPDAGTISVAGRQAVIASPRQALALGIGTVFQHPMLVPTLSVVDNLALGGPWWRKPDRAGLAGRVAATADALGLRLDPAAIVDTLSFGERQQVEIVRALMRGSRVLVLDEPTAMLTPMDAQGLGTTMRQLAARGHAVVFVTHKLDEALGFGDRITVLRHGRVAGTLGPGALAAARETTTATVLGLMFGGADAAPAVPRPVTPQKFGPDSGAPVLAVRNLRVADPAMPLAGLDLAVAAGEILGIAGIDGNGQKQLAEAIAGQRPAQGTIALDGLRIEDLDVAGRRARGLRYVTDDRLGEGTVGTFPIAINLVLKAIGAAPFWRHGMERPAAVAAHARTLIEAFDIRPPDAAASVGTLSGGNIQKVVLARELVGAARAVIFAKPTHGLDVRNSHAIRDRVRAAANRGLAAILISTDLDELLALSDTIAVMASGRIVGTVPNDAGARQRVGALMSGVVA